MYPHALHHVQLSIPPGGETTARAFYSDLLGLEEAPPPEGRTGLWFSRGELYLHLDVSENFRPARSAHPAFLVRRLPPLAERLGRAGVAVDWAEDRFFLNDPFGNRIEIIPEG
ncbi:hypothetical protein C8N32_10339 [Rhodovulum imhoffii]|uniref:VOC domain-containing protein n=1 Tax=Rhodovulum imhoffii TaxID=365340 RepID=A0A2T5BUM7_9RHOB|nr:glyoxalase [Rhodovulum imhoffii]MBK5934795.1 hypothetical protein [Rhodovulum imhoffii]PTN03197.1 hypothetical protein C8N32_10339 [Rhodovulum imhoffii]